MLLFWYVETLTKAEHFCLVWKTCLRITMRSRIFSAGMIVMGSHGRAGLRRLMMGSVAEAVTRQSPVPVTIVKESNGAAGDIPAAAVC